MPFKLRSLQLNLPFGLGGVTVEVGEAERSAAWKLYVETSARVSSQPLGPGDGSVREALSSLYALFSVTRDILKDAGPDIGGGARSLGPGAILFLNKGLRPFLTKWHAAYGDHESAQTLALMKEHGLHSVPDALIDQTSWPQIDAFYEDLEKLRLGLQDYVLILAKICGAAKPDPSEVIDDD